MKKTSFDVRVAWSAIGSEPAPKRRRKEAHCSVCNKVLSIYNRLSKCFHCQVATRSWRDTRDDNQHQTITAKDGLFVKDTRGIE